MSGPLTRPGESHGAGPVATVEPSGSGSPGGSPNEIQFNNAGSFDGASGIEFDGTDLQIAGSQGIYFRGEAIGILSPSTGVLTIAGDSQANVIGDIVYFADSGGNGLFRLETQATPVNYLTVKNSATATELAIQATGTDSNIGIKFIPKGSAGVYIGDFATGIDYSLWFLGETTSGTFKWMEDEDYFQFQDDIFMNSAERIYFRETDLDVNIYSPSANTLTITAATINLTGTVAFSNPSGARTALGLDATRRWTITWDATAADLPDTSYAYLTVYPTTLRPAVAFDPTTDSSCILQGVVPNNYGGGTLKLKLLLGANTTTAADDARFDVVDEFRTPGAGEDLSADSFGSANSGTATFSTTAYALMSLTITLSSHGATPAAGDYFRIKVTRDADNGSGLDSLADLALVIGFEFFEEY